MAFIVTFVLSAVALLGAMNSQAYGIPYGVDAYFGNSDCAATFCQGLYCSLIPGTAFNTGIVCIPPLGRSIMAIYAVDAVQLEVGVYVCQDQNGDNLCTGGAAGDYSHGGCLNKANAEAVIVSTSTGWSPAQWTYVFLGGDAVSSSFCGASTPASDGVVIYQG